ncbi:glycosyltransferase [Oligoflexus tunisiensis]|uniref:glycosyltransferase n=1 Tax=Oligoflexus tunisiensis TaxID=708132 RepID=UPI000A5E4C89|nr:glycosyltransferase [Oligoflexus tunisiensis]
MRSLKIFTWHVHGSYLYYLAHIPHEIFIPVNRDRSGFCIGRTPSYPWPDNLKEVPLESVRDLDIDCILYQQAGNFRDEGPRIFSDRQLRLPQIFLEHDPPREHPTDTKHPVDDPEILIVHVTPFNRLMWDCGRSPTRVIEHGVKAPPDISYRGNLERGIVVVNNMQKRGRRLGLDIFQHAKSRVDLDLVGMGWKEAGGIGEIRHADLFAYQSHYRFFFNPIRYTSLGLAVCEAMMIGMPIVGLATTEMVTVVENGRSGYIDTDVDRLVDAMRHLIQTPKEAERMSREARQVALERFALGRFIRDWCETLADVTGHSWARQPTGQALYEEKLEWQGA